jgi:hypothetical protein
MELDCMEKSRLKRIMETILKADEEYEKEYGKDWGSTKDIDESIMKKLKEVV